MDEYEFIKNLLNQFINNPIEIPSKLYSVQINDQKSIKNLAEDQKYFIKLEDIYLFHLSNLFNLDSEYINIIIDSNFKLELDSLIISTISKQPKVIKNNVFQYELMSVLKSNDFPENFQCLNIPIKFNLVLNDFINYYIQKKFLVAANKWINMTRSRSSQLRKKREYSRMIENRFGITPLEFLERIQRVLEDILGYIQFHYNDIIEIKNLRGQIIPKIPTGYHRASQTGIIEIKFKFETNFDNSHRVTHSLLKFDFNWMRKIFKNYFNL